VRVGSLFPILKQLCRLLIQTNTVRNNIQKDIKAIWDKFVDGKDLNTLVADLDELFVEKQLYDQIEEQQEDANALSMIKEQKIQLVCYQWFKAR
jgi:hypothetical protein